MSDGSAMILGTICGFVAAGIIVMIISYWKGERSK